MVHLYECAVRCSVLQCVAVRCSALQCVTSHITYKGVTRTPLPSPATLRYGSSVCMRSVSWCIAVCYCKNAHVYIYTYYTHIYIHMFMYLYIYTYMHPLFFPLCLPDQPTPFLWNKKRSWESWKMTNMLTSKKVDKI